MSIAPGSAAIPRRAVACRRRSGTNGSLVTCQVLQGLATSFVISGVTRCALQAGCAWDAGNGTCGVDCNSAELGDYCPQLGSTARLRTACKHCRRRPLLRVLRALMHTGDCVWSGPSSSPVRCWPCDSCRHPRPSSANLTSLRRACAVGCSTTSCNADSCARLVAVDPVTKAVSTPCVPVRDDATDDTCVALVGSGVGSSDPPEAQCRRAFQACARATKKEDCGGGGVYRDGRPPQCRWVHGLCQPT